MPQSSAPLSIKGVIFRGESLREVLLLRNERDEWELPGGKMEPNETPEACLVREFKEETGLDVTVGSQVFSGVLTIVPPHALSVRNVEINAFGCYLKQDGMSPEQDITISSEHQDWKWIPVADLHNMDDLPRLYKDCISAWAERLQ